MRDFWNTPEVTELHRNVAYLAAFLHYQQTPKPPMFWVTTKLDNGAILSALWPYQPSHIGGPELANPA